MEERHWVAQPVWVIPRTGSFPAVGRTNRVKHAASFAPHRQGHIVPVPAQGRSLICWVFHQIVPKFKDILSTPYLDMFYVELQPT